MEEADEGWLMIRIGVKLGECLFWYWLTLVVTDIGP